MIQASIDQNKCLSCGACIAACAFFQESAEGKVEVKPGYVIDDDQENLLKEAAELCPVQAITYEVMQAKIVSSQVIEGVLDCFLDRLQNIVIPSVKTKDIPFVRDKYKISVPYQYSLYDHVYSSTSKAESAALEVFEKRVYNNHRALILEALTQYRTDILSPYANCDESSFYVKWNRVIEKEVKKLYEDLMSVSGGSLNLDSSFTTFEPYIHLSRSKSGLEIFDVVFDGLANRVWNEYKDGSYSNVRDYKMYLDVDDREELVSGLFGKEKWKTMFYVDSLDEACIEFVNDLHGSMIGYDIEEAMLSGINHCMHNYMNHVNDAIGNVVDKVVQAAQAQGLSLRSRSINSTFKVVKMEDRP